MAKLGKLIVEAIRAHVVNHGVGIPPLALARAVLSSTAPRVSSAYDEALDDLVASGRIEFDLAYAAWTLPADQLPPGYVERREEARLRAFTFETSAALPDVDETFTVA